MSRTIRVLVVEDSITIREALKEALDHVGFELLGVACDGHEALEMAGRLKPDVISLDLKLPGIDGLEITRRLMAEAPVSILVLSSAIDSEEGMHSIDVLAAGAMDVLDKAFLQQDDWQSRYRKALRTASLVRPIRRPHAGRRRSIAPAAIVAAAPTVAKAPVQLIALGSSTGGPAALRTILEALPPRFPIPLIVVNHIDPGFADSFIRWLASVSRLPVYPVRDGLSLPQRGEPGVHVAASDHHVRVQDGRFALSDTAPRHSCRPSVDVLFESLASASLQGVAAALLSGMGADGAAGLLSLRRSGALTIAQDKASSTVYGMPGKAAEIGAAKLILSLTEITALLCQLGGKK